MKIFSITHIAHATTTARMQPQSSACIPEPCVGLPFPVIIRTPRIATIRTPIGSSILIARDFAFFATFPLSVSPLPLPGASSIPVSSARFSAARIGPMLMLKMHTSSVPNTARMQ